MMAANPHSQVPSADGAWAEPPANLMLPADEVHVWRAPLGQTDERLECLRGTLAPDECERAARFYFERDRRHFVAARGLLREILSLYLKLPPASLRFVYTPYGKPHLADGSGAEGLRFNVSHSGGMALYAVSCGRELGVDIEEVRADVEYEQIAERFFSKQEVLALRELPAGLRQEAFYLCWTRKEAYIKGIGEGLSLPLDSFDVSLTPGAPASLLAVRGDAREGARWDLRALEPGPGYHAALVAEGHDWHLRCWQWALTPLGQPTTATPRLIQP
jgi:4'-phosphopantetheinyl transferase